MIEIQSRQNAALKHLARLGRERADRRSTGEMLCEGEKMLGEALRSGAKLKTVLVRDSWDSPLVKKAEEQGEHRSILHRMRCSNSQVRWKRRRTSSFPASSRSGRRTRWTEPGRCSCWTAYSTGNLGTILRTAEAFALGAVVLCEGCAVRFHPRSCARRWARCSVCRA